MIAQLCISGALDRAHYVANDPALLKAELSDNKFTLLNTHTTTGKWKRNKNLSYFQRKALEEENMKSGGFFFPFGIIASTLFPFQIARITKFFYTISSQRDWIKNVTIFDRSQKQSKAKGFSQFQWKALEEENVITQGLPIAIDRISSPFRQRARRL